MPEKKPYDSILYRDGSSQQGRRQTVLLNQQYALADERTLEDLFRFAKGYAEALQFYPVSGAVTDWKAFFQQVKEEDLKALDDKDDFDPHLALYLTFLRLFAHAQNDLNRFTQRHLDFYYHKVLGLDLQPGVADNVHLVFELAKNASELLLQKGANFDAGKRNGLPLHYQLTEDVVLNKAVITDLRTVYLSPGQPDVVRIATVSNSGDGVGGKFKAESPFWDPFGLRHIPVEDVKRGQVGFALASSLFLLKEGARTLTLTLSLGGITENLQAAVRRLSLLPKFTVFYTGEKAWLSPATEVGVRFGAYNASAQTQDLVLTLVLDTSEPSVTPYNEKVHGGRYATDHPVIQVLADTTTGGNMFGLLKSATLRNCSARVAVTGITALELENDQGVINAEKPFQPFGATPRKGSSFYVSYAELMQKKVTDFQFKVTWLDPPTSFKNHYTGYETSVTDNDFFKASYVLKDGTKGTTELFLDNAASTINWPHTSINLNWTLVQSRFFLSPYVSHLQLYSNLNFGAGIFNSSALQRIRISLPSVSAPPAKGFIRFELQKGFLQDQFARVYTAAVLKKVDDDTVALPKEPYLPVIKNIEFTYSAEETGGNPITTSFASYSQKKLQFFHIDVFGQAEQHGYLKEEAARLFSNAAFTLDKQLSLFPVYNAEGALFIGLQGVAPGQSVSFLFQLAEGSSNPDKDPPPIQFAVLCNNEWRILSGKELLKEETAGLQQPGIIRLVIPDEATDDNTLLDVGKYWLRISVQRDTDAVSLFHRVLPQAATAQFIVTDKSSPANTLPAETITKMVAKPAELKSVAQPFTSFGGRPLETSERFYLRVSERLRHKDRAVMNWDYEHMVLQAFPELYKVKCLNHSSDSAGCCNNVQPGHITLVVVPDIRNRNAFNPAEPKVSTALRMKVQAFLQQRTSFFTQIHVQNPDYEKLLLQFKVKFSRAGDFGLYRERLNEAVRKHLAPWAYDSSLDIRFGGQVRKSALLNFVEELDYVSFLTEFRLFHLDENGVRSGDLETITVKNPRTILVPAAQHEISEWKEGEACV